MHKIMKSKYTRRQKRHTTRKSKKSLRSKKNRGGGQIFGLNFNRFVPPCNSNGGFATPPLLFNELNQRGETINQIYYTIASKFSKKCPLLGKYINFWNNNKTQITQIYQLPKDSTRFFLYLGFEQLRNGLNGELDLKQMEKYVSDNQDKFSSLYLSLVRRS